MPSDLHDHLPIMDLDSFIARAEGDSGLMIEMIELFQSDAPRLCGQILAAIQKNDAVLLHAAAHSLKGAVSNFSAYRATRAAASLEESGRTGDMSSVLLECSILTEEIDRLQLALKDFAKEVFQ